jgi:predicted nucleic acid-binding protein
MTQVEMITRAISSVRQRAKEAFASGDMRKYADLMADLYHLQVCLTYECERLYNKAS